MLSYEKSQSDPILLITEPTANGSDTANLGLCTSPGLISVNTDALLAAKSTESSEHCTVSATRTFQAY